MPAVVSDTSPLRCMHHLGRIDLLGALYGEILVPPAVADELRSPHGELPSIDIAGMPGVRMQRPRDAEQVRNLERSLHRGEAEALALAVELQATIIIDEQDGRAAARRLGLKTVGVLGVLVLAKRAGLVEAVSPLINRLERELGFFVSRRLRDEVTRSAGE